MNRRAFLMMLLAGKTAARKQAAAAMDGIPENGFRGFVDMEAHDRRFHHGHYEEGQRCKLREMLGRQDVVDMLSPTPDARRDVTRQDVENVMSAAQESGLLDENDHRQLMDEFSAIRSALEGLDELPESELMSWATRARDFDAVYSALAAADAEEEAAPAQPPSPPPSEGEEAEEEATQPDAQPAPAQPGETATPTALTPETTEINTNYYSSLVQPRSWGEQYDASRRFHDLAGQQYDWPPGRSRRPIRADEISKELVEQVVSHLPLNYRNPRRRYMGPGGISDMMNVLADPGRYDGSNTYGINRVFSMLNEAPDSSNVHVRRVRQIFDSLHPGYMERRAEIQARSEERRQNEQLRSQMSTLAVEGVNARNRGALPENAAARVNFTEDDARDAINRIVQRVGEANRQQVTDAMSAFQETGVLPDRASYIISQVLSADHPVRRAISEAAARQEEERARREIEKDRLRNVATLDEQTRQRVRDLAERTGVRYVPDGVSTQGSYSNGFNCYLAALDYGMRRCGLDIPIKHRPQGYGAESQEYFLPMKQAMADAGWDRLNGRTHAETVANLDRLARTMPNDYTLEMWSGGHHGTSAFLHDGMWYRYDVNGGTYTGPHTREEIAQSIASLPEGRVREMDDRQQRLMSAAIRRGIPVEQRRELQRTGQLESFIADKLKESGRVAEASFGHLPGAYTEEIIRQAIRD